MPVWVETYLNAANPYFYPAVFATLFASGLGTPISSDLVFLTLGYIAYKGQASYSVLIPLSIAAIIATDSTVFFLARRFGRKLLCAWPCRRMIHAEQIDRAEKSFQKYGYGVMVIMRFMPAVRTVLVFTGGVLKLRYWKFVLHDLIGCILVIPPIIFSVRWVAGNLEAIHSNLGKFQWMFFTLVIGLIFVFGWRRRKATRESLEIQ